MSQPTQLDGEVTQLFTAPKGSEPMESHRSIECVKGGIRGDRYLTGDGYYSPYDVCQVTFIAEEAITTIRDEYDIDLTDGRHRRNIVTRGVNLRELLKTTFRVGDTTFRGTRPRPPCTHVERIAGEEGVTRALGSGRGGICADVLEPGTVEVGEGLELVEDDPRSVGRRIVDRLRG